MIQIKDNKILAEEIMSDEELENVAGGTAIEMSKDLDNFESIGIKVRYSGDNLRETGALINAFNRFGIGYRRDYIDANQYTLNGNTVSREEAWEHIYKQVNK